MLRGSWALWAIAICATTSSGSATPQTCSTSPASCDLTELSAEEAVKALCGRHITAVQYATALLDKAKDLECLNTYAYLDPEQVLRDAGEVDAAHGRGEDVGPLCGLAFGVKDNIDVLGMPTVAGTPALEGFLPTNSSPLVTRLTGAGGVILGKIRMHELAWGVTSINPRYGPVLNAWENTMHAGGSSGGSGVLVSARGVTGAFCSDTGGSCRIPASVTGTVGLRPSLGCYNAADGIVPMSTTRDTVGVITRNVGDAILFNAIFSDCPTDATPASLDGLRLGYVTDRFSRVDKEVNAMLQEGLRALEAAGAIFIPLDMSAIEALHADISAVDLTLHYEMPRELARYLYRHKHDLSVTRLVEQIASPIVKQNLVLETTTPLDSPGHTPKDYAQMVAFGKPTIMALFEAAFRKNGVDFILSPATGAPARRIDEVEPFMELNGEIVDALSTYTMSTMMDSVLEVPGLSMPAGLTVSGLPAGLQITGLPGSDAQLLAVAKAIEAVLPNLPAPPPPACTGCIAHADMQEVTYSGSGPVLGQTTSCYSLRFSGENCTFDGAPKTSILGRILS